MSPRLKQLGIDRMTNDERLQLIGEIWDSLTPPSMDEIPDSHREELDRRIAAADSYPQGGSSWEEVRARLRAKR